MKVLPRFDAAERAVLGGVRNGCRVAADRCGRGLLVACAVPIPNPDLVDLAAWVMPFAELGHLALQDRLRLRMFLADERLRYLVGTGTTSW